MKILVVNSITFKIPILTTIDSILLLYDSSQNRNFKCIKSCYQYLHLGILIVIEFIICIFILFNYPFETHTKKQDQTRLWQTCDKVVYKQHGNDKVVTTLWKKMLRSDNIVTILWQGSTSNITMTNTTLYPVKIINPTIKYGYFEYEDI